MNLRRCFASGQLAIAKPLAKVLARGGTRNGRNASCARLKRGSLRSPRTGAMQNQQLGGPSNTPGCQFSNRILVLATAGILFLTLYPFRFDFHAASPAGSSPFFLGRTLKPVGFLDGFLNVLLFVPFGFGLAEKFRARGKSLAFTLALALAAGALLSYIIELLQFYIPQRDSGWETSLPTGRDPCLVVFPMQSSVNSCCAVCPAASTSSNVC